MERKLKNYLLCMICLTICSIEKVRVYPDSLSPLCQEISGGPNSYVREILSESPRWSTGKLSPQLEGAISGGLDQTLSDAIKYYDDNIVLYRSGESVLAYIYALGILSDVLHNVHLITTSENRFLLSDAGEVLNLITKEDQSTFYL